MSPDTSPVPVVHPDCGDPAFCFKVPPPRLTDTFSLKHLVTVDGGPVVPPFGSNYLCPSCQKPIGNLLELMIAGGRWEAEREWTRRTQTS